MRTMRTTFALLTAFGLAMLLTTAGACSPTPPEDGGGGNTNDNGSGGGNTNDNGGGGDTDLPALIKTQIIMDDNTMVMRPKAGDDLIVWGDTDTVYYIVPSTTDDTATAGTEVPEGARFAWTHFAVSGKKIALVTSLGEVRIFDTATGESRDFPSSEILLDNTQMNDDAMPGLTQSSGNYFVTLNDTSQVSDGNAVKVINVAGNDPAAWEVLSFAVPEEGEAAGIKQVTVDAQSRRVAGRGVFGQLWIWSIDNPSADPDQIDMDLNSPLCCMSDEVQMRFEGDYIIYQQSPPSFPLGLGTTNAALLNVDDGTMTVFDNNPSQADFPVQLGGGSFGYVQWREALDAQMGAGASYRSAIGRVADAPASTLASQFDEYSLRPTIFDFDPFPQEQCVGDEAKLIGYGSTMCITPDGSRWFLAGWGPIDDTWDYLQMSTGGAFVDFEDPEQNTTNGSVMATDVSCSSNVVAFRALRELQAEDSIGCSTSAEWVVGFIILDRLD